MKPEDASVVAVWYGGLYLLDKLDIGSAQSKPIVDRIRSAGVKTGSTKIRISFTSEISLRIPRIPANSIIFRQPE